MLWIMLLVAVGCLCLGVIDLSRKFESKQPRCTNYYGKDKYNYKQYRRGTEAKTLNTAKDALDQMKFSYGLVKDVADSHDERLYKEDMRDVRENVEFLVENKWEEKADKILHEFIDLYMLITDPEFSDIEKAYHSKTKCLKKYDAYWDWTRQIYDENKDYVKSYNIWDKAKRRFKDEFDFFIGSPDANMLVWGESRDASTRQKIDKRLSDCIYAMQPEYRRKTQLRGYLLQTIAKNGTIMRNSLLRMQLEGFIKEEISCCYKGLLKERLIIEVKQGDRFFVSLTEKGQRNCPAKEIIINRMPEPLQTSKVSKCTNSCGIHINDNLPAVNLSCQPVTDQNLSPRKANGEKKKASIEDIIYCFQKANVEYVDKTKNGGSLYFYDSQVADDLKKRGYSVLYAKSGTKGTQFRPAWYIRPQ